MRLPADKFYLMIEIKKRADSSAKEMLWPAVAYSVIFSGNGSKKFSDAQLWSIDIGLEADG